MTRVIIAGGGLAGCLAALALRRRRPDIDVILVEQAAAFGGNHIWSAFETDVPPEHGWLLEGVESHRWPDHEVRFPGRERIIPLGYRSLRSSALDRAVRETLETAQYRLGRGVAQLGETDVILDGGERIQGDAVIDARGPGPTRGLDLAWQKFVGRTYRFAGGHGRDRPMIMDAKVDQRDGYRFFYLLPFSDTELLVEDTYYSTSPHLDRDRLGEGVDRVAKSIGASAEPLNEEAGVLPVLLGGDVAALWRVGGGVPKLGLRGGFFHPTTGYSLPDAVANAVLLSQQQDFSAPGLHRLFRDRARKLWRERHFFQLLNRMLFKAAEPDERFRVLQHFYRLPPAVISRFYGARLTRLDKIRILSGRPPVPVGRALAALRGKAA